MGKEFWKESALALFKVPSQHLPGVTEGNQGKPQSGWTAAGIEPRTSRMLSQRSTIEPRPLGGSTVSLALK